MPRQHAEIALGAGDLHFVDALADDELVRRDDLQIDVCRERHQPFIFSAFSTASSIVPTM